MRMVVVFALLFTLVQVSVLFLVNQVGTRYARDRSIHDLEVGERVFAQLLDQKRQSLIQAAEVVSKDFAFRKAVATLDGATISSVLREQGARVNANVVMLVSPDNRLLADSIGRDANGKAFPHPALISIAKSRGHASAILRIDDYLYQVVVVPVLAPEPIAWVAMGFIVDRPLLIKLSQLTGLEVSFLSRAGNGGRTVLATTLPADVLKEQFGRWPEDPDHGRTVLYQGGYDTIISSLAQAGGDPVDVALQRSVADGLQQLEELESIIALLAVASILACILGSLVLARRVTQPIATLNRLANRAREGDYSSRTGMRRDDEIGELSASFDYMLDSIETRESEILRLAYHDTITGLANRTLFNIKLQEAVDRYIKRKVPVAVLLMDLDRFKSINDTLGHHSGDLVLQEVSQRLSRSVSGTDLVGRIGGDEFAILVTGDLNRARAAGHMVQGLLEQPIHLEGRPIDVGLSIGIAHCPTHGDEPGLLLRRADIAMYAAKRDISGMAVYESCHDQFRTEHLSLLSDLRRAVAEDELVLHFQPKLDLRRNQIVGVEALVRWQHPERGLLPPSEFLPFAEQTGTITHLTSWVAENTLRQCGEWRAAGLSLHVSLNVSSRDLLERDLPDRLGAAARQHGVPPACVVIEVTESALMEDPQRAQQTLLELKQQRFRIAIDDYGTGYSSLAYLQRLHCDELKLDRSFVMDVAIRAKDAAIVRSTVDLGHSLGLTVVAEGVESEAVIQKLRELGCDIAQGFEISRPIPASAFSEWLSACPWNTPNPHTVTHLPNAHMKAV
ncbi:MAG: EAL domain-containing protein [Burkholderiales bacterium]